MSLGHRLRRHREQNAVCVHESDLLAVPCKCHRLPFYDCDANLIGQHAHHRGVLDPGNLLQFPPARAQWNKKDVAANVFTEDRHEIAAAHLRESCGLNIVGACDTEARIAFEKMRERKVCRSKSPKHSGHSAQENHAPHLRCRTPPRSLRRAKTIRGRPQHTVLFRVVELERHSGGNAPACGGAHAFIERRILPRTLAAQLGGGIVIPQERPVSSISLIRHA